MGKEKEPNESVVAVRIEKELHQQINIRRAKLNVSLKDYITSLVLRDLASAEGGDNATPDVLISQIEELLGELKIRVKK